MLEHKARRRSERRLDMLEDEHSSIEDLSFLEMRKELRRCRC